MKTLLIIICAACAFSRPAFSQTNPGAIHLAWNYSSNQIAGSPETAFLIRATNNLGGGSATNWPLVINQPWTNCPITGFDGTNYTFSIPFQVQPVGQMYFVATASNFWGETDFSNTSSTPAMASVLKTQIYKN